jgi:predicted ATP-dependent protease
VKSEHVERAIREREFRSNLIEEKLREAVERGFIVVDTSGAVEAQVNGLAVSTLGDYTFGMPTRITARTALGSGRFVNIERESKLSGRIHSKGFMILSSYLAAKYGQNKPLALSAFITFEQTYDEVDGDSASSTELYALLSSLSGVPLKQNLAVTGSVDQRGYVQAVGGVTRKIEGFFAICKLRGLTGDQGVMIPAANLPNLTLKQEVVEAVREGKFHIYAISTIDQGIELLTGMPFGEPRGDGTYPEGTISCLVDRKLQSYVEQMRQLGQSMSQRPMLGPVSGPPSPVPAGVGMAGLAGRRSHAPRARRRW